MTITSNLEHISNDIKGGEIMLIVISNGDYNSQETQNVIICNDAEIFKGIFTLMKAEHIRLSEVTINKLGEPMGMSKISKISKIRLLTCCCCGNGTKGRQWWNQDTGFGLCNDCIQDCQADVAIGETNESYGIRGYHYDI